MCLFIVRCVINICTNNLFCLTVKCVVWKPCPKLFFYVLLTSSVIFCALLAWGWPLVPSSAEVKKCVDLFIHVPIRLHWHGAWLSTGTTLHSNIDTASSTKSLLWNFAKHLFGKDRHICLNTSWFYFYTPQWLRCSYVSDINYYCEVYHTVNMLL
jgi:hypothetical protein